ncbi:MAG: sigma-70 family RNA polymerase sigma factor [Bacteroidota bacterium]
MHTQQNSLKGSTNTATQSSIFMSGEKHPSLPAFGPAALKDLYLKHRVPLIQWLIKTYVLDSSEATELAQRAFAIFVEKSASGTLPEFKTDSNVKSYLFAIAKNKARERRRQLRKVSALNEQQLDLVEDIDPSAEEEKKRRIQLASAAFAQLGEKCQQLLRLAIIFKLSMQEIARQLQYDNTNTVKTRKYKCLLRLRQLYALSNP